MTTHIKEESIQVVATENLQGSALKAITLNGTIAASPRTAAGVSKSSVTSGQHASAVYQGLTKAYFGGAVSTIGWPVTVTTSGFLIAAGSGNSTIGRALAVVASGEIGAVAVDFHNLGFNPG
jgi:hypothetical protein